MPHEPEEYEDVGQDKKYWSPVDEYDAEHGRHQASWDGAAHDAAGAPPPGRPKPLKISSNP
jgi:hypothetical protein